MIKDGEEVTAKDIDITKHGWEVIQLNLEMFWSTLEFAYLWDCFAFVGELISYKIKTWIGK